MVFIFPHLVIWSNLITLFKVSLLVALPLIWIPLIWYVELQSTILDITLILICLSITQWISLHGWPVYPGGQEISNNILLFSELFLIPCLVWSNCPLTKAWLIHGAIVWLFPEVLVLLSLRGTSGGHPWESCTIYVFWRIRIL